MAATTSRDRAGPVARSAQLVLLAAPALALLLLIHSDGVNVPYVDDWHIVWLAQQASEGKLSVAALWAQHLENRMFFSNLVLLAIAAASHFDVKVDMYCTWAVLAAAYLLLLMVLRRHSHLSGWWLVVPSLLVFSLQQYQPVTLGFLLSMYLVILIATAIVAMLLAAESRPAWFWAGVGLAVLGTYVAVQGLALWPAGLVVLVAAGQPARRAVYWVGAAAGATALYFAGFTFGGTGSNFSWLLTHPGSASTFLVELAGGVLPVSPHLGITQGTIRVVGGVVLVTALVLFGVWLRFGRRVRELAAPLGVLSFALAVELLATAGRAQFGPGYALTPRYSVFGLWLLAGGWSALGVMWLHWQNRLARWVIWATAALCLAQVVLSLHAGITQGSRLREQRLLAVSTVRHYASAPSTEIVRYVFGHPAEFRQRAAFLQRHHLSVFASSQR